MLPEARTICLVGAFSDIGVIPIFLQEYILCLIKVGDDINKAQMLNIILI